jgi:Holliday junction resolvase RusA-like endonuclease
MGTSTEAIRLSVPGEPVPLERARQGQGRFYLPERSSEYRERIRWAWLQAGRPALAGQLYLGALFFFARPASHFTANRRDLRLPHCENRIAPPGDTDNLVKAVLDALSGCAFEDDRLVTDLRLCMRRWVSSGSSTTIVLASIEFV